MWSKNVTSLQIKYFALCIYYAVTVTCRISIPNLKGVYHQYLAKWAYDNWEGTDVYPPINVNYSPSRKRREPIGTRRGRRPKGRSWRHRLRHCSRWVDFHNTKICLFRSNTVKKRGVHYVGFTGNIFGLWKLLNDMSQDAHVANKIKYLTANRLFFIISRTELNWWMLKHFKWPSTNSWPYHWVPPSVVLRL